MPRRGEFPPRRGRSCGGGAAGRARLRARCGRRSRPRRGPVDEALLLVPAEHQRRDGVVAALRLQVARHHELLAVHPLDLEPVPGPAGHIWPVPALRDDAFEAEALGLLHHEGSEIGVLGVGDRRPTLRCCDDRGEQALALLEGRAPQVLAVEEQEVEGDQHGPVAAALAEGDAQGPEVRDTALLDHCLAVDIRRSDLQLRGGLGDGREALGPIEAVARQERDSAVVDAHHEPVAVPLELVQPLVARGHFRHRGADARLDEGGRARVLGSRRLSAAHVGARAAAQRPILAVGRAPCALTLARQLCHCPV